MEIKLNAGDKINIPAGCKATIENDSIIIEEEQSLFKDGDILHSCTTHRMVIFKSYEDKLRTAFCSYYNNCNLSNSGWGVWYFRHATEEEKQAFFDKLKAKGLRWNAETKTMERFRKRAEKGERYLFIGRNGKIFEEEENGAIFDDENYNFGNYYLPSERAQAEEDAKALKAIFEKRLKVI